MNLNKKGFTLVELLIVIVIIGILAGVVIAVIDPAAQRTKANQTVLRANVAKICQAWAACKSTSVTGATADCDANTEIGVTLPTGTPASSTYAWNATSSRWEGTLGTCIIACDATSSLPTITGTCAIVQ